MYVYWHGRWMDRQLALLCFACFRDHMHINWGGKMPNTVVVLLNVQTSKFKSSSLSLPIQNKMLLIKKEKIYHSFVANILTDHIYIQKKILFGLQKLLHAYTTCHCPTYISLKIASFFLFFLFYFSRRIRTPHFLVKSDVQLLLCQPISIKTDFENIPVSFFKI